jgi:hypothetical protein
VTADAAHPRIVAAAGQSWGQGQLATRAVVKDEKGHLHLLGYCLPFETMCAAAGLVVGR